MLRGAGMIAVALLLAWLTHSSVSEQSVRDYLNTHWPDEEMWKGYLERRGYQLVRDSALQARLLQKFVPIFGTDAAVFASDDSCLIYFEGSPHTGGQVQLWSCVPKPARPREWLRLGTGWAAFQRIPKTSQNLPKPSKKISNSFDPKEIRY